jgi:TRAP-type transport system periplasmic protein
MKRILIAAAILLASVSSSYAENAVLATTVPDTGTNKLFVDTFVSSLQKSAPDLKIDRFMNSQLGGERELIDLVKIGEVKFLMGSIHPAQYYPELDATAVPYLFADWKGVKRFLDGPVGAKMSAALQDRGNAIPLSYYYQGSRWVTTRGRSFSTLAELKGIKLRMAEIPLWIDIWSGLGATIAPMPSKEVFSAMQTGVIDAQDNMLANIWGRKLHTVSDYLINTQHLQSYVTLMVNKDYFNGLSPAAQKAVKAAAIEAGDVTDAATDGVIKKIVADIVASGVKLVVPDPSFRKDALPIVEAAGKKALAPGIWEQAVAAANGQK